MIPPKLMSEMYPSFDDPKSYTSALRRQLVDRGLIVPRERLAGEDDSGRVCWRTLVERHHARPSSLPMDRVGVESARHSIELADGSDERAVQAGHPAAALRRYKAPTTLEMLSVRDRRLVEEDGKIYWVFPPLFRKTSAGTPAYLHEDLAACWAETPASVAKSKEMFGPSIQVQAACGRCDGPLSKVKRWPHPACAACVEEYNKVAGRV